MTKKRRGRNQGSITKRGNRFRAFLYVPGGRISKSFATKTDAQSWLNEMSFKRDRGLKIASSRIQLRNYLSEWLDIHSTQLKPASERRYRQIARDYVYPYIGKKMLCDLTVFDIEGLYQKLLANDVSVRNVRYVHSLLHRSLKDALKRGIVGFNAAHGARQPKLTQKEMIILDEDQVMRFFIGVKGHRLEALFHLAIKTGMRQGEIFGLKWSDIDWQRGRLRVQRQAQRVKGQGKIFVPPKTKAGRRSIPIGSEMLLLLRKHREKQVIKKVFSGREWHELNLVFPTRNGKPLSESNLLKEYKLLLEVCGLPKMRFHDLRHTAASIMLNRGIPPFVVSRILGHSKPSTTMDIYGHLIPIMHEGIGDQMDDWLTPIELKIGEEVEEEQDDE